MVVAFAWLLTPPARAHLRVRAARGPVVNVTLTTHSLDAALSTMPHVWFTTARVRAPTLHVNEAVRYQRMLGFGGAMTDSSAWLLYEELSPAVRAFVMNRLFSTSDGIHLNLIRVPMGASDFSADGAPYSYDDMPAGESDPALADFSIAHDEAYIIPSLRQMLSIDPSIAILSTEWSPPAWMKTNGAYNDLADLGSLNPADYQPLADYFVKFIQAYEAQGIPIWGVTPENEPNAVAAYPGMVFSPAQEGQFVSQNLAPALRAAGLNTLIFGGDQTSQLWYGQELMQTPAAADLSGMAWHCYGGEQVMSQFHALYPDEPELMTECSPGIIPYGAAEAAISAARNSASSVDLWNLALDPSGGPVQPPDSGCGRCSGLVTVSEARRPVKFNLSYFQLGQLSKFVEPGAQRISTERWVSDFGTGPHSYGVTRGLDNVAFLDPDGTRALVAYNNSPAAIRFGVADHGERFSYRLPGRATVTFTWR